MGSERLLVPSIASIEYCIFDVGLDTKSSKGFSLDYYICIATI